MKVRNIIHRALLSATALFIASTASFAEESNLVVNWEGNGSADSPYLIKNANDLAAIAYYTEKGISFANVYFKMTANISLSGISWTPIGNGETGAKFKGVFDGGGFTIDNLIINAPEKSKVGLFGDVDNATIKNLTIGSNSSFIGNEFVSAVVGAANNCIISNVHNYADVTGKLTKIGGILGMAGGNATLNNCTNAGTIKSILSTDSFTFVGGIAGYCQKGSVSNCTNNGSVSSDMGQFAGGIIGGGAVNPGAESIEIIGCINNGPVSSASSAVGGIAGAVGNYAAEKATVSMCTNTGAVSSTKGQYLGGIVGTVKGINGTQILNCENRGEVSSTNTLGSIGGIAGECHGGDISDCKNYKNISAYNSSDVTFPQVAGIVGYMSSLYGNSSVRNCVNSGNVFTEGFLAGGIVGIYDGALDTDTHHYVHLKLVEGCTNTGNVTSTGHNSLTWMYDANTGGILGHGPAIVNRCYNEGDVTANWDHVGGITGALGTIFNCYNKGNITNKNDGSGGGGDVGGLTGLNWSDASGNDQLIMNSYNSGNVTAARGFVNAGNIAGTGFTAIMNCYGRGDVISTLTSPEERKKYAVGINYDATVGGVYTEWSKTKKSVWGGPTDAVSNVVYWRNPETNAGFENFYENAVSGVPMQNVSGSEQTLLSFLQQKQTEAYPSYKLYNPENQLLCEIQTVAWKEGADHYPVFEHEPGYEEPIVPTYTVTYNLNATGTPAGISAPAQQSGSRSYTVSDIVSEGVYSYVSGNVKYSFAGWNTKEDGTGDSYVAGSMITPSANTTLYGMWTAGFQVRYALASGLSADDFVSLTLPFDPTWYGANAEVTVQMPDPGDFSLKVFDFWSTEPDGSGDRYGAAYISENQNKFNITKDMVLYANVHDEWLQKIVIERTGLKAGESAVYKVVGTEGGSSFVVALEGREESGAPVKVSTTITKVPTGDYTVTETGWNWAYNKEDEVDVQPESQKKSATQGTATATMDDNRTLTFTFGGDIKGETPKHSENVKGTK